MRKNWYTSKELPPGRGNQALEVARNCIWGFYVMLVGLGIIFTVVATGCFLGHCLYWLSRGL